MRSNRFPITQTVAGLGRNNADEDMLQRYIYILGVFTENPYSNPLERNVVYIPITT